MEDENPSISCSGLRISRAMARVVRIGRREWSGLEEGRSVQEAVLKALRHLRAKVPSLREPMQASA